MIDINLIRNKSELLINALIRRGADAERAQLLINKIIHIDSTRRELLTRTQEHQAQINQFSKRIGELLRNNVDTENLPKDVLRLKAEIELLEQDLKEVSFEFDQSLSELPNIPSDDVPDGENETDNKQIHHFGNPSNRLDSWREHHKLGSDLGMMSAEIAAKMSGTRFTWLERGLARLERALGQFFLDTHTSEFGYEEVSPPILVKAPALYGVGQLPKFEEDVFKTDNGFYLIPTAEASLTNRVADQIVSAEELPLRMTALTPCFRSEAGSAGRDTVGMLRQHQFYKVELVSITTPDKSAEEHERMTEAAETVLKRLELPFRTMLLCAGDMGFSAQKTYDIEVWLPGQGKYREISSCSNCGDFQARRMNARFRAKGEKATQFVHTLNGSGTALGRALIAVMENYQQPDGSIAVPAVLQKYMNGLTVIRKDG